MAACFLAGDSIAEMMQRYLDCGHSTRVGAPTREIVRRLECAPQVVLSAGSNDEGNPSLGANLEALRKKCGAVRVVWVVPQNTARARALVLALAKRHGDIVIDGWTTVRDHTHPRFPMALARSAAEHLE